MNKVTKEEIERLLDEKKFQEIKERLSLLNEMDAAELISLLDDDKIVPIFRLLPKDMAADIFANFPSNVQHFIISKITDQETSALIEEQMVDDAVDILEELPANVVNKILRNVTAEQRQQINQFLSYPDESVGSVMTAEFIKIKKNMNVSQALGIIRKMAKDVEEVSSCYVVDDKRMLEGVVYLKDLLIANDSDVVEDIMDKNVIFSTAYDDRESAASLVKKYDLLSLPVVDKENRLVGIVTVDDIIDVLEDEVTEDIEKMAAVLPNDEEYLKTSVFRLARNRIVWLALLMFSSVFSSLIIGSKEKLLQELTILAAFIPMLTDTGGNAGSQTASIIIRSMAVGEIRAKDFLRTIWKEMRVALLVGLIMAVFAFIRVFLQYHDNISLCFSISISLFFTVLIAKIIGCCLPFLARFLNIDPALMASPVISTIMDAITLIIYFYVANSILGVH